jgi:hypothetical protein
VPWKERAEGEEKMHDELSTKICMKMGETAKVSGERQERMFL